MFWFRMLLHVDECCGKKTIQEFYTMTQNKILVKTIIVFASNFWRQYGHVWNHLWLRGSLIKSFHLFYILNRSCVVAEWPHPFLADLFNLCQLHIRYTKCVKLFFKVFDQGKRLSLFAWWDEGV